MVDQGDEDKKYNAICNLMRRLPPSKFKECISGCLEFVEDEDLQDRICESIDTPLGKFTDILIRLLFYLRRA